MSNIINFNKIVPIVSHKSPSQPLWAAAGSGGGGGGGSVVTTSSIVTSTITAAGPINDFLAGPSAPASLAYTWKVEIDGSANSADVLSGASTASAYRDIQLADNTGAPIELLREQIVLGSAQIGYVTNPAAPAATGLSFISSLNGGPDATALLDATDRFPLGISQIVTSNSATCPAGAFGVPICAPFSTLIGHMYQVSFGVLEQVADGTALGGAANPQDRLSYSIGNCELDTKLHSEISTLQGASPRGRVVTGCFQAGSLNAQLVISNNTGSLLSTIYSGAVNPASLVVSDMGPTITLP